MSMSVTYDQLVVNITTDPIFVYPTVNVNKYADLDFTYIDGQRLSKHVVMTNYAFPRNINKIERCRLSYKSFSDKIFTLDCGFRSYLDFIDAQKFVNKLRTELQWTDYTILKCIVPAGTRFINGSFSSIYTDLGKCKVILSEKIYFIKELSH
jgi:hypothetical protein